MTNRRPLIVGRILAELAIEFVEEKLDQSNEESPMLRIKGLERDEIFEAANRLHELATASGVKLELKISDDTAWQGLPREWFLTDGESRAALRNTIQHSLVFFDYAEQSDEQSLKNLSALTDDKVLGIGSSVGHLRRERVLDWLWEWEGQESQAPKGALKTSTEQVFDVVHRSDGGVSLRAWCDFLLAVIDRLSLGHEVADSVEVENSIGLSLSALGMLPDEDLFAGSPANLKKRLGRNISYSTMESSTGQATDIEELESVIAGATFKNTDGDDFSEEVSSDWKIKCLDRAKSIDKQASEQIPFSIWDQLYDKSAAKRPLGVRIREHIESKVPDRLEEFDDLKLTAELDEGDESAAAQLLQERSPRDEAAPLASLLTKAHRRALERLAFPKSPETQEPLASILEWLVTRVGELDQANGTENLTTLVVRLDGSKSVPPFSLALFRLLYSSSLKWLEENAEPGGALTLSFDNELKAKPAIDQLRTRHEDEDEVTDGNVEENWGPLKILVTNGEVVEHRLSWSPTHLQGSATLLRLVCEAHPWSRLACRATSVDAWCDSLFELDSELGAYSLSTESLVDSAANFVREREAAFDKWAHNGLDLDDLASYWDAWLQALDETRSNPQVRTAGNSDEDAFLDLDTADFAGDRKVLLATHPLRLRWLRAYFSDTRKHILDLLAGRFSLTEGGEKFYFARRSEYSPHQQPQVLVQRRGQLHIAVREFFGNEEFAPLHDGGARNDWMSTLDDHSVDAMLEVVQSYLAAHPNKSDGLSILMIADEGHVAHVEKIVRTTLKKGGKDLQLSIYLIAPQASHDSIARALEMLDSSVRTAERALPRVETVLLSTDVLDDVDGELASQTLLGRIDLALVPNFFGSKLESLSRTRSGARGTGKFDPLVDAAAYSLDESGESSQADVARALLPEREDLALESWNAVSVRRKDGMAVSDTANEQTDFFALSVRFSSNAKLFDELHKWAHWVVTLDPFVGREQIESLDTRPEVITVRPRVGKNGAYTLIVSSSAGRDFVVDRLAHKIAFDMRLTSAQRSKKIAKTLYENARHFAPGVILRALGLGYVTQELIGLQVARMMTEKIFPRGSASSFVFEAWISLDEHASWFQGGTRADLLRVVGTRREGRLHISPYVVESKFRKSQDLADAETQVRTSIDLIGSVFASYEPADEPADSRIWRRELVDSIQQTAARSKEESDFSGLVCSPRDGSRPRDGIPLQIRNELLEGDYELEEPLGVMCTVAYGETLSGDLVVKRESGFTHIRVGAEQLRSILESLGPGSASSTDDDLAIVGPSSDHPQDLESATPHNDTAEPVLSPTPTSSLAPEELASTAVSLSPSKPADAPKVRGLGHEVLGKRYTDILDVFHALGIKVEKPRSGGETLEGPAFWEARVSPVLGKTRLDQVRTQTDELKLRLELPSELEIRSFVDRGAVVFQIPKTDEERYFVDADELLSEYTGEKSDLCVPIGRNARGEIADLNFSSSDSPHLLVGGTTGAGKSVAMEAILVGLCRRYPPDRLRLLLVDPKGTELTYFEESPHLKGQIGCFAEDAIEILEEQVAEMEQRYRLLRDARTRTIVEYNSKVSEDQKLAWHVVVLDEYADLTADKADRTEIEARLKRLAQKARAAGIHVIVATQKPSAEILGTAIRSNLPAQLALRVKTSQDSRMIMDETGAETLAGKGDAFLKTARGVERIQCAAVARD